MTRVKFAAGLLLASAIVMSCGGAEATELCAALDGSGSVIFSGNDFQLQLEGLASAVEDPAIVPRNGSVTVSVVLFGSYAIVEVPATTVDGDLSAAALAGAVRAVVPPSDFSFWHRTDMADAVRECVTQFRDPSDEWVVDISTDGLHNQTGFDDLLSARDTAVVMGLDVLNALGVGPADTAALSQLVWPQPVSAPPDPGFVIAVPDFEAYVEAMRYKVQSEVRLAVAVDIKPRSCPNSYNRTGNGVLPVAILGSAELDVLQIDPATLALEGVPPLRWSYEDVAAPLGGTAAKDPCLDCTVEGPDGFEDLVMHFGAAEVSPLLEGNGRGDCVLLEVTGALRPEYGGRAFAGGDVLRIVR